MAVQKDNMPRVARYWNDTAEEFERIYTGRKSRIGRWLDRWDIYQRFDWVMDRAGDVRGLRICDIGCGTGRFVAEFAKRGAEHVSGVDVAPEMIRLSQALAAQQNVHDRCDFVVSDLLNWKTDRTYDLTIAIGVWDYIRDPAERLRVIRKLTRTTFLSAWPRLWTWRMPVRKVRLQYIRGCPVYFFRREQALALLRESGFEVARCDVVGKLFCVEARAV
ncbi:MAG TPA: methyltransferase domain-containing protein [Bryobacteraceae bacterium]|nr:methyltransferase domain-containing protein [Bryobacteraceae bacterium]